MTQPAPTSHTGWRVTGQRSERQLLPGSQNFVDGQVVSFVTGSSVNGQVFVANNDLTPAKISAAIDAKAAQLDAIQTLTAAPQS